MATLVRTTAILKEIKGGARRKGIFNWKLCEKNLMKGYKKAKAAISN